ncbi:MAG: transcription antitermination factor NusB [Pseudomonadota bacterium]
MNDEPVSTGDPKPSEAAGQRRESAGEQRRLARSTARLAAVQALYQMEITGASWREVRGEFETHRLGAEVEGEQLREPDIDHFRAILEGVVARQVEIDQLTDAALVERWPLGKIDPTLRAIFRAGGYELLDRQDVPWKVAINEYVDVAKAFFSDARIPRFANAVLDHMAKAAERVPT